MLASSCDLTTKKTSTEPKLPDEALFTKRWLEKHVLGSQPHVSLHCCLRFDVLAYASRWYKNLSKSAKGRESVIYKIFQASKEILSVFIFFFIIVYVFAVIAMMFMRNYFNFPDGLPREKTLTRSFMLIWACGLSLRQIVGWPSSTMQCACNGYGLHSSSSWCMHGPAMGPVLFVEFQNHCCLIVGLFGVLNPQRHPASTQ